MKKSKIEALVRPAMESDMTGLAVFLTGLAGEHLDDIGIVLDTNPVLPEHAAALVHLMRDQGGSLLVAECDNMLAGILLLTPPEESDSTRSSGLTMAVAEDYRRRGIGSALLSIAQQCVKAQGLDELRLTVRRHNEPAIRLYEAFAFETIEETETCFRMRWQNKSTQATPDGAPDG